MDKIKEALVLAYSSELTGLELYSKLKEQDLGDDEIFSQIASIRQKGCELLKQCATHFKIDTSQISAMPYFVLDRLDDALIISTNYELGLISMYEKLCLGCDDKSVRDLFFRLWATSANEFVPCLKLKLSQSLEHNMLSEQENESDKNINQDFLKEKVENFQQNMGQISQKLQDIVQGKADKDDIASILNNPQFAFFSGAALGALGVASIVKISKDKQDDAK